jgi:phosphoglycerate dehydrogenase-like enzyme
MNCKPLVGVGISMHPDVFALLGKTANIELFAWNAPSQALQEFIPNCDALIVYTPDQYMHVLENAPRLRSLSCHSCSDEIGKQLSQRGIRVTLTPFLWDTVADLTLSLMFAAARQIPQADAGIRDGQWGKVDLKVKFSGVDIFGKTLGILGMGRIGAIVAKRLQGFDMRLLYYDLTRKPELESKLRLEYTSFQELLTQSDFLIVMVPLNEATRGMLAENELRSMKRDAILINTARGAVVDSTALVRALRERWIRAAGLDVYPYEPLALDDPLLSLENVVLTPHLGGSTKDCDQVLVEDTLRILSGEEPIYPFRP